MNIRLKFEKQDKMKYLGHLDLMRYFQKALRRAQFPLEFSKGFHPHPIMAFAQPLSVGVTSSGEYFDVSLSSDIDPDIYLAKLNEAMQDGIKVLAIEVLPEKAKNAMSLVQGASYKVKIKDATLDGKLIESSIESLLSKNEILYTKQTKKNEITKDIKPHIYELNFKENEFFLFVKSGSDFNLPAKPVVEFVLKEAGLNPDDYSFLVHRVDIYKDIDGKLVPMIA